MRTTISSSNTDSLFREVNRIYAYIKNDINIIIFIIDNQLLPLLVGMKRPTPLTFTYFKDKLL